MGNVVKAKKIRVAVGSRNGPRSTIWKFAVNGDDVYIIPRMFSADAKVSLHASGECQWSYTNEWVKRTNGKRNSDRHLTRWYCARPSGIQPVHTFRVQIPISELREMAPERDSKKVMWIDGAHKPYTVSIECFFTLPQDSDPVLLSPPPEHYRHLISLQLSSGAWFVVFVQVISLNEDELDALREEMREMAIAAGVVGGDKVAAFISNESGTSGLIEISIEG